jgi:hypothetical protein
VELEGASVLVVNLGSRNDVGLCVYSKSMQQFKVYFIMLGNSSLGACACSILL